ncbi:MAG: AAA family ATPase [Jaaginema sp. PMC 1079.18]|nr:AAA family ATPase [Jaaginema sp. PMC 1079.18]
MRFRNQYIIVKNLEIEGIIQSYTLERHENRYALIMEDVGGLSLANYKDKLSLSITQFLNIAIQLAETLQQLHQNNIIHKDIKPANILIHPETQRIKLIDFSISTLLPKETQTLQTPNILEGTLAYISPEQTGRMNRGIDYRSDFYSLGIAFYELLAGSVPFTSDDPLELIHAHIAHNPEPLSNWVCLEGKLCPQPLSDIVLKLIAKNAEDRYQSALGLKHDLEKCLAQYQENGEIEPFILGERDICDRFLIPEKLYGRETEVTTLLKAFERVAMGSSEMMLVAGFSGIGKTAVINEIHKPITRQKGYFIKGKFDQFNRNIPFSAFVQAFRRLVNQLLTESDTNLNVWKTKILEALGKNAQVIIEVIPELERIIEPQPNVPELSGNAAQNRFNLLFNKFVQIFTTKEHPLVIFLDDLQWADSASLNLLKLLMNQSESGYLLVLGAYRDNEVFPAHPLMLTLKEMEANQADIETLVLSPLDSPHITALIADTLLCYTKKATPLSKLVYQKTQGNPFFTTQFLRGLYEEKCITFDDQIGYWQCNLTKVRELALTDNVVEFLVRRLQKLSPQTQEVLKIAACIGNEFDSETLAIVCEQTQQDIFAALWQALQEGLIVPENETYKFFQGEESQIPPLDNLTICYRFLHDRVQQAAYALIPDGSQPEIHLKIGQLLLSFTPKTAREERIFAIVDPLNLAIDIIDPILKQELITLNLLAGKRAKTVTAYDAAFQYSKQAIKLLSVDAWTSNYTQTLDAYNTGAETAYLSGNLSQMDLWIQQVVERTHTIYDRIFVMRIKLQALSARKQQKVVKESLKMLSELNIILPEQPTTEELENAQAITEAILTKQSFKTIIDLPPMSDRHFLAVAAILQTALPAIHSINLNLFQLMVMQSIQLSLEHGNTALSSFGYACYGLMYCGNPQTLSRGYEMAQIALAVAEKIGDRTLQARTLFVSSSFIYIWKNPLDDVLNLILQAYQLSLEVGDLEFVSYAAWQYCHKAFFKNENLQDLEKIITAYTNPLQKFDQNACSYWIESYQIIIELLNTCQNAEIFLQQFYVRASVHENKLKAQNDIFSLFFSWLNQGMVSYWFGNFPKALDFVNLAQENLNVVAGEYIVAIFNFYAALVNLKLYEQKEASEKQSITLLAIDKNRKVLLDFAENAPSNYQHKYELVEAEKYRVLDRKIEAIEMYDRAITGARENGYIQEEALGNELFAKFYFDWGRKKEAALYMQEAYYCYARWGAKAKTNDLEQRYPELLKPILQRDRQELSSKNTIAKIISNSHSKTATIADISAILDFSSLLKASQTLSGEIELDRLISTLMELILENAGATKGALLLTHEAGLIIEAIATRNQESLQLNSVCQSIPLENYSDLPTGLINYVRRTTETTLLNAKTAQTQFAIDNYLLQFSPQSLLCLPLLERGNLIGILYLENNLATNAFTQERIDVLDALCAQAAISLNNARLYQQSQQALQDLQEAQLQLIQSEKLATLGNLVGGVAHEINNPIGSIQGNVSIAQEYVKDLLASLTLYQKNTSLPAAITAAIEDFDLEFVAQDFPQLLDSMKQACDRICNISQSLRTFSRTDIDQKTQFNLQEGIDSTLLILKYRLKANEYRPQIKVVKNYDNLPEIECYAGQINQVLMNLVANAIDALDEANQGKSYSEIEADPNCIIINSSLIADQWLQIQIQDNGCGMKPETLKRMFEQGFTTKPIGKGTGLGMAIVQQIITEKHGGTITCESELGRGTTLKIVIPVAQSQTKSA